MLEKVFPSAADFTYRGSRIALWLLGIILVLKLVIALGVIFNGHYAATVADGIPIDSYSPQAAQAFLSLFASLGLSQFILGVFGVVLLLRYHALVPLFLLLLLVEYVASFSQSVAAVDGTVPTCDVLFIYARLAPDGALVNAPEPTIRHLAALARAAIVVLASPNPGESIVAAGKLPGPKSASLVFTIERNDGFALFFKQIFALMATGKSMPSAWVAIAPQHPSAMRRDMPNTIFVPEAGAVAFQ